MELTSAIKINSNHAVISINTFIEQAMGNKICNFSDNRQHSFAANGVGNDWTIIIPKDFEVNFLQCININKLSTFANLNIYSEDGGHANALVFIFKDGVIEIERYEPHGGHGMFSETLDKSIQKAFKRAFVTRIRYKSPIDICPGHGPQAIQDIGIIREFGFCQSWSALYIIDRLTNPDVESKEILKKYLTLKDKELDELIIKFTEKLKKMTPEVSSDIDYDPEVFNYYDYFYD